MFMEAEIGLLFILSMCQQIAVLVDFMVVSLYIVRPVVSFHPIKYNKNSVAHLYLLLKSTVSSYS